MIPRSQWAEILARDPGHSQRYIDRFAMLAAQGQDLVGEARLIDAMVGRGARRSWTPAAAPAGIAATCTAAGHRVVGVDLDPALIAEAGAGRAGPDLRRRRSHLVRPPARGAAALRRDPVRRQRAGLPASGDPASGAGGFPDRLAEDGRAVVGSRRPRLAFDDFFADVDAVGLTREQTPTWDLRPFGAGRGYPFEDFFTDVDAAGLVREQTFPNLGPPAALRDRPDLRNPPVAGAPMRRPGLRKSAPPVFVQPPRGRRAPARGGRRPAGAPSSGRW